jgi:hypothetical protein
VRAKKQRLMEAGKMKHTGNKTRSSVALLITLLFIGVACLGSSAQAITKKKPRPARGTWQSAQSADAVYLPWTFQVSLDEQIDGDDDFDYSGIEFAFSRFMTPNSALRLSLGVGERDRSYGDDLLFQNESMDFMFDNFRRMDFTSVNLALQYLTYTSSRPVPRFYIGVGPRFTFNETMPDVIVTDVYYPYDWISAVSFDNNSMVSAGIAGTLGMEFFFGRNVSLMAEYGIAIENRWYLFEIDYYDDWGYRFSETESFSDGLHVDNSHIKLGVSLYF